MPISKQYADATVFLTCYLNLALIISKCLIHILMYHCHVWGD